MLNEIILKFLNNSFSDILYLDKKHVYIRNEKNYKSCTGIISKLKVKDDWDLNARRYAIENDLSYEDVKKDWEKRGFVGSFKGTCVHTFCENYLQNKILNEDEIKEAKRLDKNTSTMIVAASKHIDFLKSNGYFSLFSEKIVYDDEYEIAGMIDQIFIDMTNQRIVIYDWKTNKEIKKSGFKGKKLLGPVKHLEECEFNTYSIQLSVYKYFIVKNLGIPADLIDLKIGHFAPEKDEIIVIDIPYLEEEVKNILIFTKNL